ncbi:putative mannose-6-phosphate isomerase [Helianthus anomalus]
MGTNDSGPSYVVGEKGIGNVSLKSWVSKNPKVLGRERERKCGACSGGCGCSVVEVWWWWIFNGGGVCLRRGREMMVIWGRSGGGTHRNICFY